MNKFKIAIFTISIIIFSLIGIKKLIYINQVKDIKNKEESFLNESIRVLNECFDLALIAMMVRRQVSRDVANKSVGEKLSPLPQ